jgi:hypothetical protein
MPVVDDSQSIIRCGNKVFLEELLRREGIATPRSRIITPHTPWEAVAELGFPLRGEAPGRLLFQRGAQGGLARGLRGAQRGDVPPLAAHTGAGVAPHRVRLAVTVLDGKLLFAARYFMARGHWQIRSEQKGTERYGRVEAVPRATAPRDVLEVAASRSPR